MTWSAVLPLILLIPVLCAVAWNDLRHMRIPNLLVLLALGLFVICMPLLGWTEIAWRLGVAFAVLVLGSIGFALRLVGGGDVKMLAALMLFVPSQTLNGFGYGLALALVLGVVFVLALRAMPFPRGGDLAVIRSPGKFPMGVSIALAGILHATLIAPPL